MDVERCQSEHVRSHTYAQRDGKSLNGGKSVSETPPQWALEEVTRHFERSAMIEHSRAQTNTPLKKNEKQRVQESPGKLEGSRTPQLRTGQKLDNPSQSQLNSHRHNIFRVWRQFANPNNSSGHSLQEMGVNFEGIDEMEEQLLLAVEAGDILSVRKLVAQGARINVSTGAGSVTPLLVSCGKGFEAIVRALIAAGAHVNKADKSGTAPLLLSIMQNQIQTEICSALLSAGANVNQVRRDGVTPLMMACFGGHTETVRTLLANGADVHVMLPDNESTALTLACQGGHRAVVALLLDAGADPSRSPRIGPNAGRTALDAAGKNGNGEVISMLTKRIKRIKLMGMLMESG